MNILKGIRGHEDLVQLNENERQTLCNEIREFLVEHISKTGGHLASNLGVVELTIAIETVYNTQKDRLVFDVGHQSYVHKLLTGRQAGFSSLRQFGGMAGFPKPTESNSDAFVAGHASSSVSIALGMARARTLQNEDYQVVTLLGDGAATGGVAYEGLNDAAVSNEPMVIILNDNAMSIDRNVGGMASHLSHLRTKEKYLGMKEKYKNTLTRLPGGNRVFRLTRNIKDGLRRMLIPSTLFESMGFTYLGPVDGHDLESLISLLRIAKEMKRPVIIHTITQKGRGYKPAEEHPKLFHGVGKFDAQTGSVAVNCQETFSSAFGKTMVQLAEKNDKLCAVTAAMPGGTGLLEFKKTYPVRTFDVGIAEEHAVSMAGGLAKQGMIPVVAIYSTFLQRAYDMILQDVALQNLHVVFAVDRAGLVGEDGETHHGVFDVGFMRQIPGMRILCPASCGELERMLNWAVNECDGPVAIRYPRGGDLDRSVDSCVKNNIAVSYSSGEQAVLLTYGTFVKNGIEAAKILERSGICVTVLRLLQINPLPVEDLLAVLPQNVPVFVLEEICANSGIKEAVAWEMKKAGAENPVCGMDLGCKFITHGQVDLLHRQTGLDPKSIASHVQEVLNNEN